jgi:hypothetical protein
LGSARCIPGSLPQYFPARCQLPPVGQVGPVAPVLATTCTQQSAASPYLSPNIEPFHETVSAPEQVAFCWITSRAPAAPAATELAAMATWLDQTRTSPAIGAWPAVLVPYWL